MKHRLPGPALGGLALSLAGVALSVVPSAPAVAATPGTLTEPARHAADWLTGELTNGLIFNNQFDFTDYGRSIDVGLALAAAGRSTTVTQIADALAPNVGDYYSYSVGSSGTKTHVLAGSLAKAAVFARIAGKNPLDFGGRDLLSELEGRVSTDTASAGRIGDVFFPEEQFEADYANTFGQAFAARALSEAGSTLAPSALAFLDAQQCSGGWIRLDLGATLAGTCDEEGGLPSIDATANAIINLVDVPAAADLVDGAVAWLKGAQREDGSYPAGDGLNNSNANSTGLAAQALGLAGETAAAADAATWLRTYQADDVAPCITAMTPERGAVAYEPGALATARVDGIAETVEDQFRFATAQALGGLLYADDRQPTSEPTSNATFVRAGSLQNIDVTGVAPGRTLCVVRVSDGQTKLLNADPEGNASPIVRAGRPDRSQDVRFRIKLGTEVLGVVTLRALAPTSFVVQAPARASRRDGVVVTVTGLAPGERGLVRVLRGDKAVGKSRRADADGVLKVRVALTDLPLGKAVIRVQGFFDDRRGSKALRITR
ncbi:prenyltransferase/squalene oxidase repeat-containing protein [Nocardioides sp.]|uniref:prenyltransferase/squalene oxidase repeat-containing protein n=1 Tax=Nocardioides sp. TaxID=35761 RepID=UPI003517AEBE